MRQSKMLHLDVISFIKSNFFVVYMINQVDSATFSVDVFASCLCVCAGGRALPPDSDPATSLPTSPAKEVYTCPGPGGQGASHSAQQPADSNLHTRTHVHEHAIREKYDYRRRQSPALQHLSCAHTIGTLLSYKKTTCLYFSKSYSSLLNVKGCIQSTIATVHSTTLTSVQSSLNVFY